MKLFELSNYSNNLCDRLIKNPQERSAFYQETINQIQMEASLKLSRLTNQKLNNNCQITKVSQFINGLESQFA